MELDFLSGRADQKEAVEFAMRNLLNLPFDSIPVNVSIEFTADPLPSTHNEFAVTAWTYDDPNISTKIAAVAPDWPVPWDGLQFLYETTAHEFGHGLFAALPQQHRIRIAEMFGAASDDIEELNPEDAPWVDRIMEGIAETFKDAFLPRRYRRYANRTNHKLSIYRYPEFRQIFREGVAELAAQSEGESFDHDVLELDYDDLEEAWLDSEIFQLEEGPNFFTRTYLAGYDLFVRVEIPEDHTFAFDFTIPEIPGTDFVTPGGPRTRSSIVGWRYRVTVNGTQIQKFRGAWAYANMDETQAIQFHGDHWRPESVTWDPAADRVPASFAAWYAAKESLSYPQPNPIEPGEKATYRLFEDAKTAGPLPFKFSTSVAAKAGDTVTIHCRIISTEFIAPGVAEEPAAEKAARAFLNLLKQVIADALPTLPYVEEIEIIPIAIPSGELEPEDTSRGSHRVPHRVATAHFEA